jgi:hypothetical protein
MACAAHGTETSIGLPSNWKVALPLAVTSHCSSGIWSSRIRVTSPCSLNSCEPLSGLGPSQATPPKVRPPSSNRFLLASGGCTGLAGLTMDPLQDATQEGRRLVVVFTRHRRNDFHQRVRRGFVKCLETTDGSYVLEQQTNRHWHFCSSYMIARLVLLEGWTHVRLTVLDSEPQGGSFQSMLCTATDITFDVWPDC